MPNRNVESHFSLLPNVSIQRSKFDRSHSLKTTFNVGDVIPIYLEEILPGDTFNVKSNKVIRLQTPITPFMDSLYLDTYYFFVPNRLVWEHWKNLQGENTESAWIPQTTYEVPQLVAPSSTGWTQGTIADYFGIPTGVPKLSVNALPFRAYALIINEFFRDENLQQPLNIPIDDTEVTGVNTDTFVTDVAKGGKPFIAAKYHDYFTSALPGPQKGDSVTIPLGDIESTGQGAVYGNGYTIGLTDGTNLGSFCRLSNVTSAGLYQEPFGKVVGSDVGSVYNYLDMKNIGVPTKEELGEHPEFSGLVADLEGAGLTISAGTISELRFAFQLQKALEKDSRSGSRYIESIKAFFGVSNPDYRLQRPEYLGGNRIPIYATSVSANSSGTNEPLGTQGAYSLTFDKHADFLRSFTEHGFIIGVCVARYDHTYQQGLEKLWTRKSRFDYFLPVFSAIGEQPIYNYQIMAQGPDVLDEDTGDVVDEQVFGYQEAWAEYRYANNIVTGEMRSNVSTSLDIWHFGDDYNALPTLSDGWIREDKGNVDRVLAVKSTVSNQLFMDVNFDCEATRPMPVYSVPGLIDHF